jgi:small subunit ribosomal protein S6
MLSINRCHAGKSFDALALSTKPCSDPSCKGSGPITTTGGTVVKRPYESMIVFDGTLPDDTLQKAQSQIEDFLKQNAVFEKTDVWGKRTLAYTIGKKKIGFYCLFLYEGEGTIVNALEHHMKLDEQVLRHQTVVRNVKNDIKRVAFFEQKDKPVEPGPLVRTDSDKMDDSDDGKE